MIIAILILAVALFLSAGTSYWLLRENDRLTTENEHLERGLRELRAAVAAALAEIVRLRAALEASPCRSAEIRGLSCIASGRSYPRADWCPRCRALAPAQRESIAEKAPCECGLCTSGRSRECVSAPALASAQPTKPGEGTSE